jgi:hypothetical protein
MYQKDFMAFDVGISLGLLSSASNYGIFANSVANYMEKPYFTVIPQGDIVTQLGVICKMEWSSSINLDNLYDMILENCRENKVDVKDVPTRIIVTTDTDFSERIDGKRIVNFGNIEKKYKKFGYEMPKLIHWNISNDSGLFPFKNISKYVSQLSGLDESIYKYMLYNSVLCPLEMMREKINDDMYMNIRKRL